MSDEVEGVFEIGDPEIDVVRIMEKIRQRIAERWAEGPLEDARFPVFLSGELGVMGSPEFSEREMYYNLEQANLAYDKVWVDIHLVPRPLPLFGRLWLEVRQRAHELVVFYVNRLAAKQVAVNEYLVRTLNHLVRNWTASAMEEQIRSLRDEIAQLEARVRELEAPVEREEEHGNHSR